MEKEKIPIGGVMVIITMVVLLVLAVIFPPEKTPCIEYTAYYAVIESFGNDDEVYLGNDYKIALEKAQGHVITDYKHTCR